MSITCHPNIDVLPEDDLTRLDTEIRADGKRYLKRRPDGACVHLADDGKCGIYEHRPAGCRSYDCRLYSAFLLGVKFLGGKQVPRWKFAIETDDDRKLAEAALLARDALPADLHAEDALDFMMMGSFYPEVLAEILKHPKAKVWKSLKITIQNHVKSMKKSVDQV